MPTSSYILIPKSKPAATHRLFLLPHSGASAAIYAAWPKFMPGHIEGCLIELPGHGSRIRETALTHLEELVWALSQAMRPYLDKPFGVLGHSFGAILGFEVLRDLQTSHGICARAFFPSGMCPPHIWNASSRNLDATDQELLEEVRQLGGTPDEVLESSEFRSLLLPALRADFQVLSTYRFIPGERLACPIVALGGESDTSVATADLEGWQLLTSSSFGAHVFPGAHFFLFDYRDHVLSLLWDYLS